MVINVRLVYKIIYKLALFSIHVSCYLNVSFIHSTILDCLPDFQVINEKETLIINKLFCFKINICHNVHAQIFGKFCIYKK